MRLARKAGVIAVVVVLAVAGAFACASKDRKATSAVRPDDDEPAAVAAAPAASSPERSDEPAEPAAPVDPFAGISGDPTVGFHGAEELLREAIAGDVAVPAFDVACVRGEGALGAPADVDARFESVALEQKVALGRVRFVRIERKDASVARLCRPVREDAVLYAPLFRVKEPASTWLVDDEGGDVPGAVRRLLQRAAAQKAKAAGPPRAVVVRGKVVAVALPIQAG